MAHLLRAFGVLQWYHLVGNICTICTNLIANDTIGKEIGANGKIGNTIGTNGTNVTNRWHHWEYTNTRIAKLWMSLV